MKQDYNHFDYFFWKNFFTPKDISLLITRGRECENVGWKDTPARTMKGKVFKNITRVGAVRYEYVKEYLENLHQEILFTNREYYGLGLHNPILNGDLLLFNTYDAKNKSDYKWHTDGSNNLMFDFKFTILINSSQEPYKGGELELFTNGGETEVKELSTPGSVVMFRSHIPHRVLPVTKGVRKSISWFILGPKDV